MTQPLQEHITPQGVRYEPSETALATATLRALAAHDPRPEVQGPDNLAELFLTEEQKAPLHDARLHTWVLQNKVAPGAYEFMIARTAFFDEAVRKALAGGLPQLVLLGAGYDSRAYRFRHLLGTTRVFELDALPTQRRKQEMLDRGGIQAPDQVSFVPIDFGLDDLGRVLLDAGFDSSATALFVWEGVTYYLAADAVDRTLAAVRSVSAPGSSLCFDYASLSLAALGEEGARKLREQMRARHPGEPARFGIPQGQIGEFLAGRGFGVVEVLDAAAMEARYLTPANGSTLGKVPALFSFVVATVV